jgi:predicted TIM-barrel fold metal-dependent hydrolase
MAKKSQIEKFREAAKEAETDPFANLTPYLKRTFDAFGAHRLMWGSDLTRLPCSYAECLDHMRRELPFLTDADRALVLGGTAAALLRWPEKRNGHEREVDEKNE